MLSVHEVREIQCPIQSSEIPPSQLTLCARHGLERGAKYELYLMDPKLESHRPKCRVSVTQPTGM